jgi:cell division septation protein DedD
LEDVMKNTGIYLIALASAALALAGCSHVTADWKSATTADTTEAYQQFLQQYPNSSYSDRARSRVKALMEDRDWQAAAAADTRTAYEQFVAQHADSKWVQEARIRIENFAQNGASTAATAAATPPTAPPAPSLPPTAVPTPKHLAAADKASNKASNKASAKAAVKAAPAASALVHGNFVQLGAFRSKERAQTQWKQLAAKFPTELKSLKPDYVEGSSKTGPIYRLRVPMSSVAAAKGLCGTLKKHAQWCVPVTA